MNAHLPGFPTDHSIIAMTSRPSKLNEPSYKKRRFLTLALTCLGSFGIGLPACQPNGNSAENSQPTAIAVIEPPPREVLIFPDELHVEDESLNEFVIAAMKTCVEGEYDAFRLIWSAREEPMQRGEFDKGWKAIEEIRILALEKVRLTPDKDQISQTPELVYALYANVKLNADLISPQQKPEREAISMIVNEQGKWRMATAPKKMRSWLKKLVAPNNHTTTQTADTSNQATPITSHADKPK